MSEVGTVYVSVMPEGRGFTKAMRGQATDAGKTSGKAFSASFSSILEGPMAGAEKALSGIAGTGVAAVKALAAAGVAAAGAAATAGAALAQLSVSAYADYQQLAGGMEKLFGEQVGQQMVAQASAAFKTAGMSANEYMQTTTQFASSLVKACGGDTARAAKMADAAIVAMSDNVNTYGTNMEDVSNAFRGLAKENYTMLDNLSLGYAGTKAGMQELIDDANKLPAVYKEGADLSIDSFEDMIEAISRVQAANGVAGTTAKEAMSTISGSIGMAQSSWQNMLTSIGSGDLESVLTSSGDLFYSLGAAAANIVPQVGAVFAGLSASLPQMVASLGPSMREGFVAALDQMVDNGAIDSIVRDQLLTQFDGIAAQVSAVWSDYVTPAIDSFQRIGEAAAPILQSVGEIASTAFDGFVTLVLPALATLAETVAPVITEFLASIQPVLPAIADNVAGMLGSIGEIAGFLGQLATAFLPPIMEALSGLLPILPQLTAALAVAVGAWKGFQVVQSVGGWLESAGGAFASIGAKAAQSVAPVSAAGGASAASAAQIAALGVAAAGVGAGIALVCVGFSQLADAAIRVAGAGPGAVAVMAGMVGAVGGLTAAMLALGPTLTAGAAGMLAFGAAMAGIGVAAAGIGAGVMMAGQGIQAMADAFPAFNANALAAAGNLAALAIPLGAVAVPGAAAGAAFVALGAGLAATMLGLTGVSMGALALTVALAALQPPMASASQAAPALAAAIGALAPVMAQLAASCASASPAMARMASSSRSMASSLAAGSASATVLAAASTSLAAKASGAASRVTALGASGTSAAPALRSMAPAMAAATSAFVTGGASATQLVARLTAVGTSASRMASQVRSSCRTGESALSALASTAASAASRIAASFNGLRLHIPSPTIGALPHFSISGGFNLQTGSVPSINVSWYARGGVFDSPRVIGVGDASTPEVVAPQAMLYETALEAQRDGGAEVVEAIDRLAAALPRIIAEYTPGMGERDLKRMVRACV